VLDTLLADATLPLVNVNLPRQPHGLVWTRTSVRRYDGRIVPTKDPLGRELYWFTVTPIEGAEKGTPAGGRAGLGFSDSAQARPHR
jgi:5'-nucleotidase